MTTPETYLAGFVGLLVLCLLAGIRAIRGGRREDRIGAALYRPPESKVRGLRSSKRDPPPAEAPTAVLVVRGFDAVGLQALSELQCRFGDAFRRVVFATARPFDGVDREEERRALLDSLERSLRQYGPVADLLDMAFEVRVAAGPDPLESLAREVAAAFQRAIFFFPRLELEEEDAESRRLRGRLEELGLASAELWIPVRVRG